MNNRPLALLVIILAVVLFFGYVNPTWNGAIAETKNDIDKYEEALQAAKAYTDRQAVLVGKRNEITQENHARIENFLPNAVDNVRLILALNALASRSGFALSNIDVSAGAAASASGGFEKAEVSPVSSIDLTLSAVGSYAGLLRFLEGVEKSQRLLDVRDLVVTGSNSGVYTFTMILRLYWLR